METTILIIVAIALAAVAYIQGDGNGYKRGRREVIEQMKNVHSKEKSVNKAGNGVLKILNDVPPRRVY